MLKAGPHLLIGISVPDIWRTLYLNYGTHLHHRSEHFLLTSVCDTASLQVGSLLWRASFAGEVSSSEDAEHLNRVHVLSFWSFTSVFLSFV